MARQPKGSWGSKIAKGKVARRAHVQRCAEQGHGLRRCYLGGTRSNPLYPICPELSCEPSCQGIRAAFLRAQLNKDPGTRRKAESLGARRRCF